MLRMGTTPWHYLLNHTNQTTFK